MSQHEDLFIKISTDFHNEINASLKDIDQEIANKEWYCHKNIHGKFFLIKPTLLSLNGKDVSKSKLMILQSTLKFYHSKLVQFFENEQLATGFVYFAPDDIEKTQSYFDQFQEYTIKSFWIENQGYRYYIDINIIGFPNDCSYKLLGRIKEGKIIVIKKDHPFTNIEIEKGKLMITTSRSRSQQNKIEDEIAEKNKDSRKKIMTNIAKSFMEFCEETRMMNEKLLLDFEQAIVSIDLILARDQNDGYLLDINKIEAIFKVLSNGYINVGFDEFKSVFKIQTPLFKIVWLKSGPRLKYLIDRLNLKYQISTEINLWAAERYEKPNISDMATYLRKQTSKAEYHSLIYENIPKDDLYRVLQ